MAYFYYNQGDHSTVTHIEDVYLIGKSDNYLDDNTYVIYNKNEVENSLEPIILRGWNIKGGLSMTVGGVKTIEDLKNSGYTINKNTRTYNIYQQIVTGQGHQMKAGYPEMTEYSAVHFVGDGTMKFISQTGATTSANKENTIAIFAKNTSSSNGNFVDESTWSDEVKIATVSVSEKYPTGPIDVDSNAIKADGKLTIATDFSGKIDVQSRQWAWGVNVQGTDGKKTPTNTANGMSNKATAFLGSSVTFDNDFFGTIDASARVSFGSFAARTVSNNNVGAYGVYAESGDVDASKSIWSGLIFASNNNSVISAVKAVDATGKVVDGSSNATNNIFESIGIHGTNVSIKILDSSYNKTDVGANVIVVDGAGNLTQEQIGYVDSNANAIAVMIEDGNVANYTQAELKSTSGNPLFGLGDLMDLNDYNQANPDDNYALISAIMGKGKDIFIYEDGAMMLVNADVYESGSWGIVITDSNGDKTTVNATIGGTKYYGVDPLSGNAYSFYVVQSSAFMDVASAEILQYGEEFFTLDVNGKTDVSISDTDVVKSIALVTSGEGDKLVTTGIRWTIEVDGLEGLDKTAADAAIDAALANYDFIIKYSYTEKVNNNDVTMNVTEIVKWGDSRFSRSHEVGTNDVRLTFASGKSAITIDNISEAVSGIDTAIYGIGQINTALDTVAGKYVVSFVAKGNQALPDWTTINDTLKIDLRWTNSKGELFEIKNFDLTQGFIDYEGTHISGDYYLYTAEIATDEIVDANGKSLAEHFFFAIEDNVVISAKVLNNEIVASNQGKDTGSTMTGNEFTAVGIDGTEKVTVGEVAVDTVIEVEASDNTVLNQKHTTTSSVYDNTVTAIGIKGKEVNLGSFDGTINATANNNYLDDDNVVEHKSYMYVNGIKADTLNVASNLNGNINVTLLNNTVYGKSTVSSSQTDAPHQDTYKGDVHAGGIYVAGDMTVDGVINTNITVNASGTSNGFSWDYGIYVEGTLKADSFSGTIVIDGEDATGLVANSFAGKSGSLFEIGGGIYSVGSVDAVAVGSRKKADLVFTGIIVSDGWAVKTDYTRWVSEGFYNDTVEFKNGSITSGIIDLGGGTNTVKINSGAVVAGYTLKELGTTNMIFYLNEITDGDTDGVQDNAIYTVTDSEDASLVSGKTITLNVANMQEGKYVVYNYVGGADLTQLAENYWKNARVSIQYMEEDTQGNLVERKVILTMIAEYDNSGNFVQAMGFKEISANHYLVVTYKDGKVTAEMQGTIPTAAPLPEVFTLSASENGENLTLDSEGNRSFIENEALTISNSNTTLLDNYVNSNGGKADLIVDNENNTSNTVKLTWLQSDANMSSYKKFYLQYIIKDEAGNVVSNDILVLDGANCKSGLQFVNGDGITNGDGLNYIAYNYTVAGVKDGYTIEWGVADYTYGDRNNLVPALGNITTKKLSFISTIDVLENMSGVNPNNIALGINSAVAKLSWQDMSALTNYNIDYYNVRYFFSENQLDAATKEFLFGIFDQVDKTKVNEKQVLVKDGAEWGYAIINGSGEWQVVDTTDVFTDINGETHAKNIYHFYEKTTTTNELVASGLSLQDYVYWFVQGVDSTTEKSHWFEGVDFRPYDGDVTGPKFDSKATLSKNEATFDGKNFKIDDLTWTTEPLANSGSTVGDPQAKDDLSGVRRYIVEYQVGSEWKTLASFDANEVFDEKGNWKTDGLDFKFENAGVYTLRVVAVDAAGNYGDKTTTIKVVAQDTLAPIATAVNQFIQNWDNHALEQGYVRAFSWNAVKDAAADANNLATGVDSYTIDYKFFDESNDGKETRFDVISVIQLDDKGALKYVTVIENNVVNASLSTYSDVVIDMNGVISVKAEQGVASYFVASGYWTYYDGKFWIDDDKKNSAGYVAGTLGHEGTEGDVYNITIGVSDKVGNNTVLLSGNLENKLDVTPPEGSTVTLKAPVVTVTKRATAAITPDSGTTEGDEGSTEGDSGAVVTPGGNSSLGSVLDGILGTTGSASSGGGYVSGDSSDGEETRVEMNNGNVSVAADTTGNSTSASGKGTPLEASVKFSWSDDFTDNSGKFRYLLQVSADGHYSSDEKRGNYTFLVVSMNDSAAEISALYNSLIENYPNLRVIRTSEIESKSVTFDNSYPSVPVGLFSGMYNASWRVKAVDMSGNEAVAWPADGTFSFVDPETGKVIYDTFAPATPYDLDYKLTSSIVKEHGVEQKLNNGEINLSFSVDNTYFGIDYFTVYYVDSADASNNGEIKVPKTYFLLENELEGDTYTDVTISLRDNENLFLKDGKYNVYVNSVSANGQISGNNITVIQDTEAPVFYDAKGNAVYITAKDDITGADVSVAKNYFGKEDISYQLLSKQNLNVDVRFDWGQHYTLKDELSGVDHYIVKYRQSDALGGEWYSKVIKADALGNIETSTVLSLVYGYNYDVQVVAVDKAGNETAMAANDKMWSEKIAFADRDSSGAFNYDTTIAFADDKQYQNESIGSLLDIGYDLKDTINIGTVDAVGEMQLFVSNARMIDGNGTLTMKVWKKGAVADELISTNSIGAANATDGVAPVRIQLANGFPSDYYVTLEVSNYYGEPTAVWEYDFKYKYEKFDITVNDDTPFMAGVKDLKNEVDQTATGRVGYGDAVDWVKFTADEAGFYNFNLSFTDLQQKNWTDYVSFKVYRINPANGAIDYASGAVDVVYPYSSKGSLANLMLDKGEYYIAINAPYSTYGTNVGYEIKVDSKVYGEGTETFKGLLNGTDGKVFTASDDTIKDQYIGIGENSNFYGINLTADSKVSIDVANTAIDGMNNWGIALNVYRYSDDGKSLALISSKGVDNNKEFAANLGAGSYVFEVVDNYAAYGTGSKYDLTVNIDSVDGNVAYNSTKFVDTVDWDISTQMAVSADKVYKLDFAGKNGWYQFNGDSSFTLYKLADGKTLEEVGKDLIATYLDKNVNYYIAVDQNASGNLVGKELDAIVDDKWNNTERVINVKYGATDSAMDMVANGDAVVFDTWVGKSDTISWTKLNIEDAGSFKLGVKTVDETADVAGHVTLNILKANSSGSLDTYASFTVWNNQIADYNFGANNLLLGKGEYYIQVVANDGANHVSVSLDNNFVARVDGNNSYDTATSITASSTTSDWVGFGDMTDCFRISGKEVGGNNKLTLTVDSGDAWLQANLYQIVNGVMFHKGVINVGPGSTPIKLANDMVLDENAEYIVKIDSLDSYSSNNYSIATELESITTLKDATVKADLTKDIANSESNYIAIEVTEETKGKYTFAEYNVGGVKSDKVGMAAGAELYYYDEAQGGLVWVANDNYGSLDLNVGTYYLKYNYWGSSDKLEVEFDSVNKELKTIAKNF